MVSLTFITAAAVLASNSLFASAAWCDPAYNYCANVLFDIGYSENDMNNALVDAGKPNSIVYKFGSLYHCGPNGAISFAQFCGLGGCRNAGAGNSDYCG
ncbi:hypothetical protein MGN70_007017 [Eutypa lata]|nr:hypothetical protein MGN70_007017 [Eutypa lata]